MSAHIFRVVARDGGGLMASATYQIMVLDENDNTPTFLGVTYIDLVLPEDTEVRSGCGMGVVGGCVFNDKCLRRKVIVHWSCSIMRLGSCSLPHTHTHMLDTCIQMVLVYIYIIIYSAACYKLDWSGGGDDP